MGRILVVDDERHVRSAFEELLGAPGHEVVTSALAEAALEKLQAESFDLVIMDIRMPGLSGLEALRRIRQAQPNTPVILMTGQGTMETAIAATSQGAFEYLLKPFEPADMLRAVERALETGRLLRVGVAGAAGAVQGPDAVIGRSPAMQEVYKAVGRVAATDATVLVRGESGTGKELIARAIHQHSLRAAKPLLAVNCVAIPETLLESELFGYEPGAFTGAAGRRIGKFEEADGGTIFLDEIGDIPLAIQGKILRVLQERAFERLGGNKTIRVDVRVLAATNRDLERAMAEGTFRDDLFHRLNVVSIRLPPLGARREDIPDLVRHFTTRFARELNVATPLVSDQAMELLRGHSWPGNVRELEHCIQRVMIFTHGFPIQADDLRAALEPGRLPEEAGPGPCDDRALAEFVGHYLQTRGGGRAHEHLLNAVERLLLAEALRRSKGNRTHAARLLGLPRPTLHAKMQKHGIAGGEPSDS